MINNLYRISTLGPKGTDSERAALHYALTQKILDPVIQLYSSFESALDTVRFRNSDFAIVPAAYNGLFSLHLLYRDVPIIDTFILPTKPMVLAKIPGQIGEIRRVAIHPATKPLLPESCEPVYVESKPLCLQMVADGKIQAGIGSEDVAESMGLEIVKNFGPIPMTWEVFGRESG